MNHGSTHTIRAHRSPTWRSVHVARAAVCILVFVSVAGCHLSEMPAWSQKLSSHSEKPGQGRNASAEPAEPAKPASVQHEKPAKKDSGITPTSFSEEHGELIVTLESAMQLALQSSKDIQVISTVPQEVQSDISIELSQFDPTVSSNAQFGQSNQQAASTVQALGTNLSSVDTTTFGAAGNNADQLQIAKQWQSGTVARLGYNSNYNYNNPAGQFLIVNPAWRSGLRLTLEQPLMQGARTRINQSGIRIARLRFDQSSQEFRAEVNRILHEVEVAYWRAHLSELNVESLRRMVAFAEQTWQHERQQQELGISSIADESQSRENLEATRAQLAAAERDQSSAYQQLRQKLGVNPADTSKLKINAAPYMEAFTPDLESGIQQAVAIRPEVKAQKNQVSMTALDVERKRDGLLPDLNLLAGYGLTGLDHNFGGSMSDLSSADYGNWSVGVTFQQTLGQRDAKGRLRQSELVHTRARRAESAQIDAIQYEVRDSYQMLQSAFEVLQRQNARLEAAQTRFDTHRRMYEMGQLNIDRLMPSQEAYMLALRDQHTAMVQYNLSIHRWHYVTGQLTMENVDPAADHQAISNSVLSSPAPPETKTSDQNTGTQMDVHVAKTRATGPNTNNNNVAAKD
jgi:outer membrane protein TolC